MINETLYAVKNKSGHLIVCTVSYFKTYSIQYFRKAWGEKKTWKQYYREGFRIVKVKLTEEK